MRTRSPLAALLALAIACSAYAADDPVIVVEPEAVEFGEIPTGKTSSAVITVTNNGDTPRKLIGVRASCGCTAVDVPELSLIHI